VPVGILLVRACGYFIGACLCVFYWFVPVGILCARACGYFISACLWVFYWCVPVGIFLVRACGYFMCACLWLGGRRLSPPPNLQAPPSAAAAKAAAQDRTRDWCRSTAMLGAYMGGSSKRCRTQARRPPTLFLG
jgi:hypothetical protein